MLRHPNLVAWYKLDGNAKDSSGSFKDGINTNGITNSGKSDKGYSFDETGYIWCPLVLSLTRYSIGGWVKSTYAYSVGTIFGQELFMKVKLSYNKLIVLIRTSVSGWDVYQTIYEGVVVDAWNHIFVVFDNNTHTLKFYLNGNCIYTNTVIPSVSVTYDKNFQLNGYGGAHENIRVALDDFQIYNKALSESDIKRIMMGLHPLN